MKIAAYVDANGTIVGLYDTGNLQLYQRIAGSWTATARIPLRLTQGMGLAELRRALEEARGPLSACDAFVGGRMRGIVKAYLEEIGLHVWEADGAALDHLDAVAATESGRARHPPKRCGGSAASDCRPQAGCGGGGALEPHVIEQRKDGRVRLDLIAILDRHPGLNSRQVLLPLLQGRAFTELEIIWSHRPRWFDGDSVRLGLCVGTETPDAARRGSRVTVRPAPPVRQEKTR